MRAEASWGIDALRSTELLGVRWTEQLPAAMRVLLMSEPPRLLINAGWWRRAAGGERRQALDALCYGPRVARSNLQLWGRRPLNATGLLRHTLDSVPGEFWDRLVQAPYPLTLGCHMPSTTPGTRGAFNRAGTPRG